MNLVNNKYLLFATDPSYYLFFDVDIVKLVNNKYLVVLEPILPVHEDTLLMKSARSK